MTLDLNCRIAKGGRKIVERGVPSLPSLTALERLLIMARMCGAPAAPSAANPNSIGGEGAAALVERGLPSVPPLTSLSLYNNDIGSKGARAFERALCENPPSSLPQFEGIDLGEHVKTMGSLPDSPRPRRRNAIVLKYLRSMRSVGKRRRGARSGLLWQVEAGRAWMPMEGNTTSMLLRSCGGGRGARCGAFSSLA